MRFTLYFCKYKKFTCDLLHCGLSLCLLTIITIALVLIVHSVIGLDHPLINLAPVITFHNHILCLTFLYLIRRNETDFPLGEQLNNVIKVRGPGFVDISFSAVPYDRAVLVLYE